MAEANLRVLSLIPPMTQLNTPYPSTACLTGFLRSQGVSAFQEDLAIRLVLRLLSPPGLRVIRSAILNGNGVADSRSVDVFLNQFDRYESVIAPTIRFLQNRDSTLAFRICSRSFLPEGPRFSSLDEYLADGPDEDALLWAFGALGIQDRARHFATLFLTDIADVIRDGIDSRFEFVRYGESLAQSQPTFDPLASALAAPYNLIDEYLNELTEHAVSRVAPDVVLITAPFPGTVYAAFRIAQTIRRRFPAVRTVLGGGFVNTELRELSDVRVFDYFHFVTLDAGERPLLALLEHLRGQRDSSRLIRTFLTAIPPNDGGEARETVNSSSSGERVVRYVNDIEPDVPFEKVGTPTWDGLPLSEYLSTLDLLNPMHRLWSDGRWNKLIVAHGCYWRKCSFCDVTLDYISRYDAASASVLADRIESIVAETGQTGFHLVDEAAPPKTLRLLAEELIRRRLQISWWGNVRFEKSFTPDLCRLLADSGCIAISGGLEVASDRLLTLMKKGVSVTQVAQVTKAFAEAGILVHAYLMYGFPTQTVQDTVDALEYVRQLFEERCLHSGYFHRFTCTVHSPVGQRPEEYGVTLIPLPPVTFAKNDIAFIDPAGVDHDALGIALNKALYNFMHGIGLQEDIRSWFTEKVPRATVPRNHIARALFQTQNNLKNQNSRRQQAPPT